MTFDVEDIADGTVGGNEALSLTLGFEPLHLSFSSPDRQMGIFNPVVVS